MKNATRIILLVTVAVIFFTPMELNAQDWWMTNSLKLPEMPENTLFHAEGEYSFMQTTGNVKMTVHRGAPAIFVRNRRVLFNIFGRIDYQKIQVRDDPTSRSEKFTINSKLIYDLTRTFQTETGLLWERDNNLFIDRRMVYYTGLIYNELEAQHLGRLLFGAIGYQQVRSVEFLPLLPVTKENKPVAYVLQQLVFKSFQPITFSQRFSYIIELDDDAAYRTELMLSAQVPLSEKIVFVVAHETKYESQPLIPDLAPFFEKMNTTFTLGVRFTF